MDRQDIRDAYLKAQYVPYNRTRGRSSSKLTMSILVLHKKTFEASSISLLIFFLSKFRKGNLEYSLILLFTRKTKVI